MNITFLIPAMYCILEVEFFFLTPWLVYIVIVLFATKKNEKATQETLEDFNGFGRQKSVQKRIDLKGEDRSSLECK